MVVVAGLLLHTFVNTIIPRKNTRTHIENRATFQCRFYTTHLRLCDTLSSTAQHSAQHTRNQLVNLNSLVARAPASPGERLARECHRGEQPPSSCTCAICCCQPPQCRWAPRAARYSNVCVCDMLPCVCARAGVVTASLTGGRHTHRHDDLCKRCVWRSRTTFDQLNARRQLTNVSLTRTRADKLLSFAFFHRVRGVFLFSNPLAETLHVIKRSLLEVRTRSDSCNARSPLRRTTVID